MLHVGWEPQVGLHPREGTYQGQAHHCTVPQNEILKKNQQIADKINKIRINEEM
jgi:hypothetical protein